MKCPGQDTQFWDYSSIFEVQCPRCCGPVEFFKDDTTRKCGRCGNRMVNPRMDFGCASHCPSADKCLENLPQKPLALKENPALHREGEGSGRKNSPPDGGVQ